MSIKTAFSLNTNADEAVNELKNQLDSNSKRLILFFASSNYDQNLLALKMQEAFPNVMTIGCSTAGEIVTGKMLKNSLVAMAFDADIIADYKPVVLKSIKETNPIPQAFEEFEKHFGIKSLEFDPKKFVGIILIDGLSGAEERLMEKIGDMTNVTFIGGSAGDDLKFKTTYVYCNGKAMSNAAVMLLMKASGSFDFIKTQSFCDLGKKLVATKVNEANREVVEFNNKPAAEVYAEMLGKSVDDAANYFMKNPVGLMSESEPFVRSPQQIKDNSMIFYCNIKEGMELSLLESTNIVEDTRKAIETKINTIGPISGIVNFHCILRTLELDKIGKSEDYGNIFANIPRVGFSTYGEQFVGHINQTSTMLVFQ